MLIGIILMLIEIIMPRISLSLTVSLGIIPILCFVVGLSMLAIGAIRLGHEKMKMSALEISPKAGSRLHQIQKISRLLKVCVLFYFVVPLIMLAFNLKSIHLATGMVAIFNHPYASASDIPKSMYLLSMTGAGVYLLGIISFYRLLSLYEKGVIFSGANVSEMRKMGSYLVGYGILALSANIVYVGSIVFPLVLLEVVASPWIVAGGAVYIIAWIMDEGRKIQEEQELTV
jgi:hypothetical protein